MSDVFVSYKAEDRARVRPLVDALEADGLSVWWDAHIGGGDEWRETIARHLDDARCVIVVWSKRSVGPEGRFVRDEAARSLKRGAYLPVRIDKVEPPLGLRRNPGASADRLEGRSHRSSLPCGPQRRALDDRAGGACRCATPRRRESAADRCWSAARPLLSPQRSRRMVFCSSPVGSGQQHRRPALRQSQRRPGAGLFLRRSGGGIAQRLVAHRPD